MISGEQLFSSCTQLHSLTIKTGLTRDTFFASKLINLYTKLTPPQTQTARRLFDETPHRTLNIWNCILKCYCRDKQYQESLSLFSCLFSSERPDLYTVSTALKACSGLQALHFGKIIHGFVKKCDQIGGNLFLGSALVDLYSKCGRMDDALRVFEEYSEPDAVLWTTMITGYEKNGETRQAFEFFAEMMMAKEVVIDPITLISVVSACAQMLHLKAGRSVHGYMVRVGLESSLSLLNALLNLYGKTGSVSDAAKLFKKIQRKDVISWGSMISCYAHHDRSLEALDLFDEMVASGIEPNVVSLISALQACETTNKLEAGRRIHKLAVRKGLASDILVSTALIDMYMNCSSPEEAIEVFQRMPRKDAVCFSSLLHGCVRNGRSPYESISVLRDMLANSFQPDAFDLVKILTACSESSFLRQTSCLHGFTIRSGMSSSSFIGASLIESYAKCGSLDGAVAIFKEIRGRDVVTWSSMLAAYGFHGKAHEALELFNQMINKQIKPNDVLFLSILSACSHTGLVKEGVEIFDMMVKEYKNLPNSKHYGIVVDLLGRVGELDRAMGFIGQMEEPVGSNVWRALLGACRVHQNMEIGEIAAKKLLELDPCHAGDYILLSNMYAVDEKWDDVAEVRKLVRDKRLKKVSGQSVIEVRDEVCTFLANDRSHQDSKQIYELLRVLEGKMKEMCNVFSMDVMLLDNDGIP